MQVNTGHRLPKPAKTGHKLPKPVQAMANSKTGDTFVPVTPKSNPMASITKKIPGGFSGKAGTARTGPHPEQAQMPPGCGEAGAPAGEVQTGDDRISPAAEEHHRSPQPGKGISPAWQDPPGNGKSECDLQ